MADEDQDIDDFVRAICLAHPELRDGGLEKNLEALQEIMLSIGALGLFVRASNRQGELVGEMEGALEEMGEDASTIKWETTGAMLLSRGLLAGIGANVAGNMLGGVVQNKISGGKQAVAGPSKLFEFINAQANAWRDKAVEQVPAWEGALAKVNNLLSGLEDLAKAHHLTASVFQYEEAKESQEAAVASALSQTESSLTDAITRCNEAASKTLQEFSQTTKAASAAGGVAIASLLASWASSREPEKSETQAEKNARLKKESPLHNPFYSHG